MQISSLESENETLLFLDAFDEDPQAVEDPHSRLRELMAASAKFKNVIITCRSRFFENDDRIPKSSGIMYAGSRKAGKSREFPLYKLFLAPFNQQQVERYLAKNFAYSSFKNIKRRRDSYKLVKSIPELSIRPMLLELVPDLVRDQKHIDQLFGLYDYLVESWLKRERDWIDENNLKEISTELAVTIFLRQRQGLGDRISASFLEEIAVQHNSTISTWKLKSRSLLNRDIEGNYKFAHRSVMEFLVLFACLRGDERALHVEWTDLMKDLLVSLANTDTESEKKTLELLDLDLSKTKVFPLATSIEPPRRLSLMEFKRVVRNENVSKRHTRKIPVAWRNRRYDVKCIAKTNSISSLIVNDQTHGISWMIHDFSQASDPSEMQLYADRFSDFLPVDIKISNLFGSRVKTIYRHPSVEEIITLWQCESFLCEKHKISRLFDKDSVYWVGDRLEDSYVCCSFGSEPRENPELKLIDSRTESSGKRIFFYELLGKYGLVNRDPYRAFCAYIMDDINEAE